MADAAGNIEGIYVEQMFLRVEVTPGSGVFTELCGIEDITETGNTTTVNKSMFSCLNPSAPATILRRVTEKGSTFSISGTVDLATVPTWRDWNQGVNGSVRLVQLGADLTRGGALAYPNTNADAVAANGYDQFSAILTDFSRSFARTSDVVVTFTASLQASGALTWNPVAIP